MANQIVPLSNAPNQSFAIALEVDAGTVSLQLAVRYNEVAGYWVLSVADRTGALIVDSVPMLTGYYPAANLLQQHGYLGIGSAYVLNVSGTTQEQADSTNLGTDFVLLWGDTAL